MPSNNSTRSRRRRWLPIAMLTAGVVLLGASVAGLHGAVGSPSPLATSLVAGRPALDPLSRMIEAAQRELRADPDDSLTLGTVGLGVCGTGPREC